MKGTQQQISHLTHKYGAMTMLFAQEFLELNEHFEVCQMIQNEIKQLNELGCDIPLRLEAENYEADYKQAFNRLGLSGETAFKNNQHQVVECISEIIKTIIGTEKFKP